MDQLVAVQDVDRPGLLPRLCCETDASPTPERLALGHGHDLRPEAGELGLEELFLAGRAADDHSVDARRGEERDLVGGERPPRDRDERLRPALRRVAEPLGLAAG